MGSTGSTGRPALRGVGLGLRWSFLDEVVEHGAPAAIPFFEVSPENYMRRGGYFPDALMAVGDRHPLITHGLMLNIGSADPLDRRYLDELRGFLREVGADAHSDHLCWTGVDGHTLHDLLPMPTRRDAIDHVVERVQRVQDHLGVPMALENISYYLNPGEELPEHEWVAEVVERSGCRLLLDVNNVWVNARNHGYDPYEILRTMPLDRVAHLHVAGGERLTTYDDLVIDTHGTDVDETVEALMAWVIERTGPVPVVYERDHDIPPLAELARQVARLNEVYETAVDRWRVEGGAPNTGDGTQEGVAATLRSEGMVASLDATQRSFSKAVLDTVGPSEPGDLDGVLRGLPVARVDVYRRLVRNGMRNTVRRFIPRTAARLGSEGFGRHLAAWLEQEGPKSRYLRDIPHEFGRWATARWPDDTSVDDYLVDLLRHELVEMEVDAAPARAPREGPDRPLELHAKIRFDPAVRIVTYGHRVHELSTDEDDREVPSAESVTLLVYRDDAHDVRFLELTPFATALVSSLLEGHALVEAVRSTAASSDMPVDDALLVRSATLLADLAERGAALGPA